MTVESVEALVDEYLRVIVRTRPWTRRREEASLGLLVGWADPLAGVSAADGEAIDHALLDRCETELGLDPTAREGLRVAVGNLNRWARARCRPHLDPASPG